jgi:hypothetical protein
MELTRLTPEILLGVGFRKVSYRDEETDKEVFHFELPLSKSSYCDFVLITNASDEEEFPVVRFCGVSEYEILHVEPLIVLMNLLQSLCIVEDFKLDQQFKSDDEN